MLRYKIFKKIGNYVSLDLVRKFLDFTRHYFLGLFHRIDKHHIFLAGAGIAFSLILSIIPFLLILFSVFANLLDSANFTQQVNTLIETVIPYPEYAQYVEKFLLSRITEVIQYRTMSGYIGAFALFFTSTWLFSSIRTSLNNIFGVSIEKHALVGLLRDFGMVILLILFILLMTIGFPFVQFLQQAAEQFEFLQNFRTSELFDTLFAIGSTILIFILFYLFYYLIPYEKLGRLVPAIGALWATILWEIARGVFGYYVSVFLSGSKVYGAFVLIIVILFWLFYSSLIFLLGAEIAQLFREKRERKKEAIIN